MKPQPCTRTLNGRGALRFGLPLGLAAFLTALGSHAATFVVDDAADTPDDDRSDGVCADNAGRCTLRAALQQANATPGMDTVEVPALPGNAPYVITGSESGSALLIEDSLNLEGDGPGQTIIDGQASSSLGRQLLRVRTSQGVVLDMDQDRLQLIGFNGLGQGVLADQGALATAHHIVYNQFRDEFLALTFQDGIHRFSAATGAYLGVFLAPDVLPEPYFPTDLYWDVREASDLDDDYVYITDQFPGGDVLRYRPGTAAPTVFVAGSGTDAPTTVLATTIGGDKAILVGYWSGVIRHYNEDGTLVGTFASGIPGIRHMVRMGNAVLGSILVSSEGLNAVMQLDPQTGASQGVFASPGEGGLNGPRYLTLDREGQSVHRVYVVSHDSNQILAYTPDGDFERVMVSGGTSTVSQVGTLALRHFDGGPGVNMRDFTLTRGSSTSIEYSGCLGIDRGASANATNISVEDCYSSTYGGGIRNDGTFYLYRGTVSGNSTASGIAGGRTSVGGGISNSGYLHVEDSLIVGNDSQKGGGISTQDRPIPGLFNDPQPDPSTTIVNSTISGNTSDGQGGGVRVWSGVVRIASSTIARNTTNITPGETFPHGGGIWVNDPDHPEVTPRPSIAFVGNTIIAENSDSRMPSDPGYSPDCYTEVDDQLRSYGNNIVGLLNADCNFEDVNQGDRSGIIYYDPSETGSQPLNLALSDLGDHGGPTLTHYLGTGSVAVDAHTYPTLGIFECGITDQRFDSPRPLDGDGDGNAVCDIGAVEVVSATSDDDDGDGIHDFVDTEPTVYSNEFSDLLQSGNTTGEIVTRGSQAVTVEDADGSGLGVVVRTDPAGHSRPAIISACDGNIYVEMGPGEEQIISCLEVSAGGPYTFECVDENPLQVSLEGHVQSAAGGDVEVLWSAPTASISPADELSTTGEFSVGGHPVLLEAAADGLTASDSIFVTVTDNVPPVLTVPPDIYLETCGGELDLGQATAVDNCSGELTPYIVGDVPDISKAGTYTVVWETMDSGFNQVQGTQTVVVSPGFNAECCPDGYNQILGTFGNDVLTGTEGPDCILAYWGDDVINGLGGDDIINGGLGNDAINGGTGNDLIQGGPGVDTINGGEGNDSLSCGDNDDQCSGGNGDDVIGGGAGNDTISGGEGNDTLSGGIGNDTITGGIGNDSLSGGDGNDSLQGEAGDDEHLGGANVDQCIDEVGTNTFLQCENIPGEGDVLDVSFVPQGPGDAWGYCIDVEVTNPNMATATNISISFQVQGGNISNSWSADRVGSTGIVTMTPNQPTWNTWIDGGDTKTLFGFCVQHDPNVPLPTLVSATADLN